MLRGLQLKISLAGIKPLIWRRVIVNSDLSLEDMHNVIATIMPWSGGHLHQFIFKNTYYTAPCEFCIDEDEDGENFELYNSTKIGDLLKEKDDFLKYEYDFGDSWIHNITVEKIIEPLEERRATYIKGKNMTPPEDCGGVPGYANLLEAMKDPNHPEHESMREWLCMEEDETFDPTYIGCDDEDIDDELFGI